MDIDITDFFNNAAAMDYSASCMEIGQSAGADTWRAACDDSETWQLLKTDAERAEFRAYVKGFGAWDESEIAGWSNLELNALCIQMVAGDIREGGLDLEPDEADWNLYRRRSEDGQICGRLWNGDENGKDDPCNGHVYYTIGE